MSLAPHWKVPLGLAAIALLAALGGCQEWVPLKLCGEIPEGGCPLGRGGTCDDALCSALYDCVDGAWTVAEECSGGAAGGGGAGGAMGTGGAGGGGACTPVTIDHAGETTGCKPELQEPDCPAVAAEGCAESVCLTGCLDFFLCKEEGWTPVAWCDDDANLMVVP